MSAAAKHGVVSGFPVKIQYAPSTPVSSSGLLGQSTLRPDVVGGCNKGLSVQPLLWFNPKCFLGPGAWSFGDEPRVDPSIKQDGVANWDFAAFKSFGFGERVNLQFRAEFFNLFNVVNMGLPANTLAGAGFGVISHTAGTSRQIQFSLKLIY